MLINSTQLKLPFIRNAKVSPKIVGLSSGRAGTSYSSALLQENGFAIGHESIFTVKGPIPSASLVGDISWLAVPYIGTLDCPFFTISREPSKIITSFIEIGFFNPDYISNYKKYARRYFHFTGDPGRDAINWCIFHLRKSIRNSDFHYRLNTTPTQDLLDYLESVLGKPKCVEDRILEIAPKNQKTDQKNCNIAGIVFPEDKRSELLEFAEWSGYPNDNLRSFHWH